MGEAREFAQAIHERFPEKLLAYNCSPSFNWRSQLDDAQIASFQDELGALGYRFQFVTLAGFHALNESMFELARGYNERGMSAYVELQEREFALEEHGYTATRHQREVGAGYFDAILGALARARPSRSRDRPKKPSSPRDRPDDAEGVELLAPATTRSSRPRRSRSSRSCSAS